MLRLLNLISVAWFVVAPALVNALPAAESQSAKTTVIPNTHPLIYYHGRWDSLQGSWWPGTGIKLNVANLKNFTLNLGEHTSWPNAPIGVSVNYAPFVSMNVSQGANVIPLDGLKFGLAGLNTVVRLNVEGYTQNRIQLESIEVNQGAVLLPYVPSSLVFQIIGDSFSSGYTLPNEIEQSWPFLISEEFKAEEVVTATPGITLTDIPSFGNARGMSYMFFQTEDTGFYYTTDHNFTTPWNFRRNTPPPTHVIIHLGANDASQNVSNDDFVQNYLDFLTQVRKVYPKQPLLLFTPWGWPYAPGEVAYYYDGLYQEVHDKRWATGDHNVFLVNCTGWVTYDDVFPDNLHPNVEGNAKIAGFFSTWLKDFGVQPRSVWPTITL